MVALRSVAGQFVDSKPAARCEVLPFVTHLMETLLLTSTSAHLLCQEPFLESFANFTLWFFENIKVAFTSCKV